MQCLRTECRAKHTPLREHQAHFSIAQCVHQTQHLDPGQTSTWNQQRPLSSHIGRIC